MNRALLIKRLAQADPVSRIVEKSSCGSRTSSGDSKRPAAEIRKPPHIATSSSAVPTAARACGGRVDNSGGTYRPRRRRGEIRLSISHSPRYVVTNPPVRTLRRNAGALDSHERRPSRCLSAASAGSAMPFSDCCVQAAEPLFRISELRPKCGEAIGIASSLAACRSSKPARSLPTRSGVRSWPPLRD
jgi:hypothetical protein